jgi:hypothetical protein
LEQTIKILLIFIGFILIGAIVFGIVKLTRLILNPLGKTVSEWNTLREESSV